ncbi:MAG: glycosyltransferase family 2 protein [Bdellovibrionales bacterium]|nr:glycosyltransferase family 2 protein [Bdellovibrionales bacterium]
MPATPFNARPAGRFSRLCDRYAHQIPTSIHFLLNLLSRMHLSPPTASADDVFVIVPVFNEASVLGEVLRALLEAYPNVVVVDDCSHDDSGAIAASSGATVLRHIYNLGQGASLQTGIDYALRSDAQYIVTFDGDGQHRVEDIERLLQPLRAGTADVALGSRFLESTSNIPAQRRILLRAAVLFSRATSRLDVSDAHNGLRAFTHHAASRIHITMDRMAHASQLLDQIGSAGLRFTEVAVTVRYTDYSLMKGQKNSQAAVILRDYLIGRLVK